MSEEYRPIEVYEYSKEWPFEYIKIRDKIESIIGDLIVGIHHVGSTSVSGLAAKPIIDIDVEMDSHDVFGLIVDRLQSNGYIHNGNQGIEGREAFIQKPMDGFMNFHLYVCPWDSVELKRHIAFRDYLIKNPERRDAYAKLKKEKAIQYRDDREGYTNSKSEFILSVLAKMEW